MDIKLHFLSEDFQCQPRVFLIKNSGILIWTLQWLWFEFEIVKEAGYEFYKNMDIPIFSSEEKFKNQ